MLIIAGSQTVCVLGSKANLKNRGRWHWHNQEKKIKHIFRSTGKFCTCSKLNRNLLLILTPLKIILNVFQLKVSKVYFKNSEMLTFFLIFCSVFSNWNLHPYYIISQVVLFPCKLFDWEQVFYMKINNNLLTVLTINVLASTLGTHISPIG